MDKSSLEGKIKDRLSKHSEPVDHDALYSALGIAPKKKKRRFVLFVFCLSLLGIAGFALYYGAGAPKELAVAQNDIHKIKSEVIDESDPPIPEVSGVDKVSESSKELTNLTKNNNDQNDTFLNSSLSSKEDKLNNQQSFIAVTSKDKKIENNKASNKVITALQESKAVAIPTAENVIGSPIVVESEHNKIDDFVPTDKTVAETESLQLLSKSTSRKSWSTTGLSPSDYGVVTKFYQEIKANVGVLGAIILDENKDDEEIEKGTKYALGTYVAYDRFQSDFSTKSAMHTEYVLARENAEKALENISIGLEIRRDFNRSFYGTTALEYSQYNYQFKYTESIFNALVDTGLVRVEINYVGDTSLINGVLNTEQEIMRRWTRYNNLMMLNIPINIGYQFKKNNWSYFAETGLTIGLISQYRGQLFNASSELIDGKSLYRLSPNLFYNLGLGISYSYNNHSAVQFKMRYRQSLIHISSSTNPLNENIRQVGLQLSYVYTL